MINRAQREDDIRLIWARDVAHWRWPDATEIMVTPHDAGIAPIEYRLEARLNRSNRLYYVVIAEGCICRTYTSRPRPMDTHD